MFTTEAVLSTVKFIEKQRGLSSEEKGLFDLFLNVVRIVSGPTRLVIKHESKNELLLSREPDYIFDKRLSLKISAAGIQWYLDNNLRQTITADQLDRYSAAHLAERIQRDFKNN